MKIAISFFCCSVLIANLVNADQPAPPAAAKSAEPSGYFRAGFDRLASYSFTPPEPDEAAKPGTPPPSGASQIPAAIKALDGQKVIVTGFVMPVKMEKGFTTELL